MDSYGWVLSFWSLPPKSSKCLDVLWPKRIPRGQKAIRFPGTRSSLALQLWMQGGRKKALSISHSHPREETPAPEWQRGQLSAKGWGVGRQISQHNRQEKNKNREVFHMEAVSPNVTKLENPTFCNLPTLGRQLFMPESGEKGECFWKGKKGFLLASLEPREAPSPKWCHLLGCHKKWTHLSIRKPTCSLYSEGEHNQTAAPKWAEADPTERGLHAQFLPSGRIGPKEYGRTPRHQVGSKPLKSPCVHWESRHLKLERVLAFLLLSYRSSGRDSVMY